MSATPITGTPSLLTATRLKTYRRCPREHDLRYLRRLEPTQTDDALGFGSLVHAGLEVLHDPSATHGTDRVVAAVLAMRAIGGDAFELARAEELLVAYAARWAYQTMNVIGVEVEFEAPLINPDTGASSRTFRIAGKLDALVRLADGSVWVMEHKTSSEDISPGSAYWQRLRMDGQVSHYFDGAAALGYEIAGVIYDVIGKPALRPLKATPTDSRKYTKAGALYSGQRDRDETVEEFRARIREAIAENPAAYFARGEVVRLESERREHRLDTWQLASQIREAQRTGCHPRNPDACQRYGKNCAFLPVCTGMAGADDPLLYRVRDVVHPELKRSKEETTHGSNSNSEARQ